MQTFLKVLVNSPKHFLSATVLTLELTIVSLIIALIIGLVFALFKLSSIKPLEWISDLYVWIVRGTPLIVQIFVIFYGLTAIYIVPAFWAATIGLAFHNGAYIAEIFRGAIQGVDKGQREAGRSLGMSAALTMRRIILPQAFKRAVPPLANQFIIALKDSSLAAFIGMQELFGVSESLASNNYAYMPYFMTVSIYYLVLVLILTIIVNRIERRFQVAD